MQNMGAARKVPPMSFSTLGCPDWDFDAILDFAVKHGYRGIEVRGVLRVMDLPKCPVFSSPEAIAETLQKMKSRGLRFVDLGSSAELHISDPAELQKQMDEARRFIDLAQQLQCPFIRVFPNRLPKEENRDAVMARISKNLLELGKYAETRNVTVLIETHGDLSASKDVLKVIQAADHPHVGLIWDIVNMWSVTKEPVTEVYGRLKKWIRHTHIKDMTISKDGKERYVFVGKGDTPVFEAIDLLYANGYKGFYSFEWEKLWHPDIDAPELALADFPEAMKVHFSK